MSQGKYSPRSGLSKDFTFNAYGEVPPPHPGRDLYDGKIHFGDYDSEGFDSYGYSAFHADGTYAGAGNGVDRDGYTESEYLAMPYGEFETFL